MGNCLDCQPDPPAVNITEKVGKKDGQLTEIRVRDLPNYNRWIRVEHKNPDGSDITLRMIKERIAHACNCEPQQILCYYADYRDLDMRVHSDIRQSDNLSSILFDKKNVELHYIKMDTPQYSDGVYKAPPLGEAYPVDLSVKEWSSKHVLWWLEMKEQNLWLAEKFKNSGITGRQLLLISETTLRDFGVTDPGQRLRLLDSIRQLQ